MESKFQRWWLGCCVAAVLLASWVGGFSVSVTAVFIVIYLTGMTLIGPDEAPAEPVDVMAAEPVDVVAAPTLDVGAAVFTTEPAAEAEPAALPEAELTVVAEETTQAEPTEADSPEADSPEPTAEPAAEKESTPEAAVDVDEDAVPYPDDIEDDAETEVQEPTPA